MSAFDDFLADDDAERCWLLEVDAFPITALTDGGTGDVLSDAAFGDVAFSEGDASSENTTLCYSDNGFTSQAADTPASKYYETRIAADVRVERAIVGGLGGGRGIGGLTQTVALLSLVNGDGGLDSLQQNYALEGRPARVLIGRVTTVNGLRTFDARSAFNLVFSGVVEGIDKSDVNVVRLSLSDGLAKLRVPLNPSTYAGTGSIEGGSDLTGKPKPRAWGNAQNVSAPLVVAASLIYQANDGPISDVTNVYDRGVALVKGADYVSQADMEATAPAAANYRVWKAGGFFRLGSIPAGTVTADVLGDASGAGYVNTTADILQRVLFVAGVDASLIDAAAFATLNVDAAAEVGIWYGAQAATVEEAAQTLLQGVGAFGGFTRNNLFTVGVVKAPSGVAAASYTEQQIGSGLRRLALPGDLSPAVWRTRVAWGRNYTLQNDLAATVTAARRAFAAEAERVAERTDLTVRSQRQIAQVYGPNGNLYALQADADTESLRLLGLWKGGPGFYEVPLPPPAMARDLGDVVTLTHSRYGLSAGKDGRVLGHKFVGTKVTLTVLAP